MALASASRARCSGVSMRGALGGAEAVRGAAPVEALRVTGAGAGAAAGAVPRTMVTLPPSTSLQSERPLIWLVYSLPQR